MDTDFSQDQSTHFGEVAGHEFFDGNQAYSIPAQEPMPANPMGHQSVRNPGPAGGDTLAHRP